MNKRKTTMQPDTTIIRQFIKGDKRAFEYIFNTYYDPIYTFTLNTLFDNFFAEDITQSVFLALWENRHKIDPEKGVENYLYTIARNKIFRQTEQLIIKQRHEEYIRENQPHFINFEDNLHSHFLETILFELIDQLPTERRKIFLMSRKENLSNKEIARKLELSEKTVETQIRRSLIFLKEKIQYFLSCFL